MVEIPTLTDGTVTLRGPREDDLPGSVEQCNDPLTQQWTTVPVPYGIEDARAFLLGIVPRGWETGSSWAFVVEAEGRYAGVVELRDEGHGRAEIAYGSHPWVRGTGHVERALRVLLEWGFAERGLRTVVWWANHGNWASRKLAWRLGFAVEGAPRQWLHQRGRLLDSWVGTLLSDDPREPRTPWLDAPTLGSDGVRLRELTTADAPRLVELFSDDECVRWVGDIPVPYDASYALAWLERQTTRRADGVGVAWAVTAPDSDDLLGTVALTGVRPGHEAEVGYLLHPEGRGRGLATAAARLAVEHAFGALGVRRVKAMTADGNVASRAVLERLGFTGTGRERRAVETREGWVDAVLYDVLAEEWPARA